MRDRRVREGGRPERMVAAAVTDRDREESPQRRLQPMKAVRIILARAHRALNYGDQFRATSEDGDGLTLPSPKASWWAASPGVCHTKERNGELSMASVFVRPGWGETGSASSWLTKTRSSCERREQP